ncbi:alpha/beta hydrolase [Lentibacillus saliphilus]|uniref:alpha/beta hydrolase n=1 Tax=Lentibacillus saliphilus TaxID=2737028 RepID=UPI001C2F44AD|nr:alpha/beta fold hydrolase [Lentibacillus saliphilus]
MAGCLIIHGYTGGPHELEPLVAYLREHMSWDIETPTLPGHGETLTIEDMSHEKWLTAAEHTLKELQKRHEHVYVIGFSMGGMIASYLAAKYNVSKLVLLAPSRKFLSFKQIMRDIGGIIFDGVRGKAQENKIYMHYRRKLTTVPIKANVEFLKLVRHTRAYMSQIQAPVLIAQGQQDHMVPYRTAFFLDKEITSKQKEIVLFEKSRHLICLGEDRDTLNKIVHDFLADGTQKDMQ